MDLTYIEQPSDPSCTPGVPACDAGDLYRGLDRFGRVVDQRWLWAGNNHTDRFAYGYDRNSNRLYRDNLHAHPAALLFDELYHPGGAMEGYDDLNQLKAFKRGTLNGTKDDMTATTRTQNWTLDVMGNWDAVSTESPNRVHNKQNQATQVGGNTLGYDNNGNTTNDQAAPARTFVYDAWNRLVRVTVPGMPATPVSYAHDALGRRLCETSGGTAESVLCTHTGTGVTRRDLYYSSAWQVLEEQVAGQAPLQYVWSPVYVDALVLRDSISQRVWVQQDANWNVTALVASLTGNVLERYVYDPYGPGSFLFGEIDIITPDWSPRASSQYAWVYLHQGGRHDAASGLYQFRNREYSPTLGRWMQQDPIGFAARDSNLYRYVGNNSVNWVDPTGLQAHQVAGGSLKITARNERGAAGDMEVRFTSAAPLPQDYLRVRQWTQLEVYALCPVKMKDKDGNPCTEDIEHLLRPGLPLAPPHPDHPHESASPYKPNLRQDHGAAAAGYSQGKYRYADEKTTLVYSDTPTTAQAVHAQAVQQIKLHMPKAAACMDRVRIVQRFVTVVFLGTPTRSPVWTVHWTSTSEGPPGKPSIPKTQIVADFPYPNPRGNPQDDYANKVVAEWKNGKPGESP